MKGKEKMVNWVKKIGGIFLTAWMASILSAPAGETIPIKTGETLAFLGDSITQRGTTQPWGYCRIVLKGLKEEGVEVTPVFAGKSGHNSNQMLARVDKDVISKKPDWMLLSCGMNDINKLHRGKGVELDVYKENITKIIDKAQAAGIKVMVLTTTPMQEQDKPIMRPYNAFLRELAEEKDCLLADVFEEMMKPREGTLYEGKKLTIDGVHMNVYGNMRMAKGVLKAFGVPEAKLTAKEPALEKWCLEAEKNHKEIMKKRKEERARRRAERLKQKDKN